MFDDAVPAEQQYKPCRGTSSSHKIDKAVSSHKLTLLGAMGFSIQLHRRKSEWFLVYLKGSQVIISENNVFLSLKIDFVLALPFTNGLDPDQAPAKHRV